MSKWLNYILSLFKITVSPFIRLKSGPIHIYQWIKMSLNIGESAFIMRDDLNILWLEMFLCVLPFNQIVSNYDFLNIWPSHLNFYEATRQKESQHIEEENVNGFQYSLQIFIILHLNFISNYLTSNTGRYREK